MIGNNLSAFGLVIAIVLYGCAGISGVESYVNKNYQATYHATNKLAIVPLTRLGSPLSCTVKCPPLEEITDESFEKSFSGLSGRIFVIPMAKSRAFFETNSNLLSRLLDIKYTERELGGDPSLKGILGRIDLASLREQLDGANLLLVPAKFDLVPNLGKIFGSSEFRLYDLYSGSMIYSSSRNMNVDRSDEPGRGLMALVLIGTSKGDFEKFYLNKR